VGSGAVGFGGPVLAFVLVEARGGMLPPPWRGQKAGREVSRFSIAG